MSHFSVGVVIPAYRVPASHPYPSAWINEYLDEVMAPYEEQTDNAAYLEFVDKTSEAKEEYETGSIEAVRFPDGRVVPTFMDTFYKRFRVRNDQVIVEKDPQDPLGDERETEASRQLTLIPEYPLKECYQSLDDYCSMYCGYRKNSAGAWGYTHNPNAKWDWFTTEGRFSGMLLVRADAPDCLINENDKSGISGYCSANGARMKDIAWGKMQELIKESAIESYNILSHAFATGDKSELGPLSFITKDGIEGWGEVLYRDGESLEEFMSRRGATDEDKHPFNVYAFVDASGKWHAEDEMGWWGISTSMKEPRSWKDEVKSLMEAVAENDYLVVVDCHI